MLRLEAWVLATAREGQDVGPKLRTFCDREGDLDEEHLSRRDKKVGMKTKRYVMIRNLNEKRVL